MWPILVSVGPFQLKTLSLLLVLAFFTTAFVFWRKGREEHYHERQLFDGFLLSTVFGFLIARLAFILFNFYRFGWSWWRWLDLINYPGFTTLFGLVGAALYLARFARKKHWDVLEVLDFWVMAVTFGLFWYYLGHFFNGSLFGTETNLAVGLVFPGVLTKHHPVQLYLAGLYLVLFVYLSWSEYHYRTFEWYRAGKKSAQTGFLVSNFLIFAAAINLLVSRITPGEIIFRDLEVDGWFYGLLLLLGIWLLMWRSGRSLLPERRKNPLDKLKELDA